jgi:hypothetical protein
MSRQSHSLASTRVRRALAPAAAAEEAIGAARLLAQLSGAWNCSIAKSLIQIG